MNEKKKRSMVICVLCGVLFLMVIGYAAFNTMLNIEGTTSISSNWNILITNVEEKNKVGEASTVDGYPTYENLTAEFQTNLVSPGDSIEYDITVENQGNLNAELARIKVSENDNEAIKFTTSGLEEGNILEASGNATLTVKVEYSDEVTSQPDNLTANLTVTLDYVQEGHKSEWTPDEETASEMLIKKVTTQGDGLYEDEYEPGRYVYRGAKPDNYITFNGETAGWRIVAVENDGTIKIIRNASLGSRVYDSNQHRATGFCYYDTGDSCNVYAKTSFFDGSTGMLYGNTGAVNADSQIKTYLEENYLPTIKQNKESIVSHNFYYGPVSHDNTSIAVAMGTEKRYSINVKIGLPTLTDVLKSASLINSCGGLKTWTSNTKNCEGSSWLATITTKSSWTLTPYIGYYSNNNAAASVVVNFGGGDTGSLPITVNEVLPVVFLDEQTKISGTGIQGDPYTITNYVD